MSLFSVRNIVLLITFLFILFPAVTESTSSTQSDSSSSSDSTIDSMPEETEKTKKAKFNPITFVGDILNDKYRLRVDFGAEPNRHGSMVFAATDFDWSESFSQRLRLEYDHYSTSTNSTSELSNQEVRSISATLFPLVFYFGDSSITTKTRFSQVNIGVYFNYSITKTNTGTFFNLSSDKELWGEYAGMSGFSLSDTAQKYHLVGPVFGYSVNFPLHEYISLTLEGFFVPAYLVTLSTELKTSYYFEDGPVSSSNSLSFRSLSFPIARQTISFDFFRYLRIKGHISYQHLNLRALTISDVDIENYSVHTLVVRYGGEILSPSKTRKKSAHLWAGLYYEMTWNKNYLQDLSSTDYTGKWVLCFSK